MKILAPLIAAMGIATSASAVVYELEATPLSTWPGFKIVFDDLDNDSLLSADEVQSFSTTDPLLSTYVGPFVVPEAAGYADGSGVNWVFANPVSGAYRLVVSDYSYNIYKAPVPPNNANVVPLPASGLLLAGLIGGAAALRRRKK